MYPRPSAKEEQESDDKEDSHYYFCSLGIILKISGSLLPGASGSSPKAYQDHIPQKAAQGGHEKEAFQIHSGSACRDGDQTADNGDETAEKYRIISLAVKPVHGFLDILLFQPQQPAGTAVQECLHPLRRQQIAGFIQDQRACQTSYGGGDHHAGNVHTGISGHKAAERQYDFGWNGRKDIFHCDEKGNAQIAVLVHNRDQPVIHRAETSLRRGIRFIV